MYDEHPMAGQDIQYGAPNIQTRYTTPFDDYKITCKHVKNPGSQWSL